MIKYRVYPSLLNEYARFVKGNIDRKELLNRINRVQDFDQETMRRMRRGTRFEKAVLKRIPGEFDPEILQQVRNLLPKSYAAQYALSFTYEDVQFYGYADLVGNKSVVDIKTTQRFKPEKYSNSFQNLYLYALKDKGCERMEYIVYDFEKLHHLVFSLEEMDFEPLLSSMLSFREFLEENRKHITDKKIFIPQPQGTLF